MDIVLEFPENEFSVFEAMAVILDIFGGTSATCSNTEFKNGSLFITMNFDASTPIRVEKNRV